MLDADGANAVAAPIVTDRSASFIFISVVLFLKDPG
jgi:hypothetical protein